VPWNEPGGGVGAGPAVHGFPTYHCCTLQRGAWNYIIIYESGDLSGSAASLAEGRVAGGTELTPPGTVRPKADFHFVVDNVRSRRGAVEGDVEVGLSWQNQAAGAPYAGWSDYRYHSYSAYKIAVAFAS